MSTAMRILMVEDDEVDAELTKLALLRAGVTCELRRVDEAQAFNAQLSEFVPQLIISDFGLPKFDGFEALAIARRECPDVPFIFASGSIGQARAENASRLGAAWYVEKGNFVELSAYVKRLFDTSTNLGACG